MLLGDVVDFNVIKNPDGRVLMFEDRVWTFRQMQARINRVGNALLQIAAPGDRVAIWAENCPEYVECLYGVPTAGMALTFLNYRLNPREIAKIVANAEPSVLIVEQQFLGALEGIRSQIPTVRHFVAIGGGDGAEDYAAWTGSASTEKPKILVDERDLAWLIYTSGTTGMPKGAMLSHKNILSACCNALIGSEPGQDVVYLFPFPLCHVAAYAVISNHLSGFPLVLMRRFDPEAFLASIGRYQATSAPMAPTMINFVLQHPKIDDYDYGTLRDMGYGASAIPREVLKRAMDRFGNIFMQGFGMTELAGNVLFLSKDDHQRGLTEKPELLTAAGRPRPLAAVRVVDEGMNDVALGQVGEIVVRGDQVMMGYWEMPEATEAAFAGGWLHTGDMARIDEEGYFYVVDRLKDMIVTGGENVYPREVEQVIYEHPAVSEVAVIGLPDESWGENVVAVVALQKGTQATEKEIIGLCRDHLAGYKKPKRVEFVDELPKNVSGKILKRELRTRFG